MRLCLIGTSCSPRANFTYRPASKLAFKAIAIGKTLESSKRAHLPLGYQQRYTSEKIAGQYLFTAAIGLQGDGASPEVSTAERTQRRHRCGVSSTALGQYLGPELPWRDDRLDNTLS